MKFKNDDTRPFRAADPPSGRRISFGWIISAILALALILALLFVFAAPIGERFLEISRQSNPSAFREAMSSFIELAASHTPRPTYTPNATYTPLPSQTPYPTYTPFPTSTSTFTPTFTATPTDTPTPTPIPPAAVIAHIHTEAKAELVVSEYNLNERNFHVGVNDGLCSFGGDYTAQGTIEAGLDLTALDGESIQYDPNTQTYTLLLPAPQLTKCDVEYIRLVENSFSLCSPDFDRLRRLGEIQVMSRFIDRAIERGIVGDAKDQAALILEDLVRTFTGKKVKTEYETTRGKPKMDQSCRLSGSGWSYNRSENVWTKLGR